MAGLDSTGLTIKRYPEIFSELNADLKDKVGNNVDTSESSFIGNLHAAFSTKLAELYELSQSLYDANNVYNAEGANLDNLAVQVGITRKQATKTSGTAWFEGADGVLVPSGTRMKSSKGDEFVTTEEFTISATNCIRLRATINTLANDTEYTISLDGVGYSFTSDSDATYTEVLNGLKTQLDLSGLTTNTVVIDGDNEEDSYILIERTVTTSSMNVTAISYVSFDFVVTPQDITADQFGVVSGDVGIVNEILSNITDWYSITNNLALTEGKAIENDNDLRLRIFSEFNTIGSGTVESLTTNLLRVEGVTAALVKENYTDVTDGEGIPPKSFECIVNGGDAEDIAEVVWDSKPAGIYAHGTVLQAITDFNGYSQNVRFSRPDIKYITIRVQYTTYDEETLPSGAIDSARQAILDYASANLTMDTDVIAKRFLGSVYGAATGFGDITIKAAAKDNPGDAVIEIDYNDVIAISDREMTSFASTRVLFEAI